MKNLFLLLFVMVFTCASAQSDQQDINEQVWKPFTKAIINQDVTSFVAVHSTDLIRVERDEEKVMSLAEYKALIETGWPKWKESVQKNKSSYNFELRFTERISNGTLAYEVGYFKNESTQLSGEKSISYGKFQVALRKEKGVWKIVVDSDTRTGLAITAKDFMAAQPLE